MPQSYLEAVAARQVDLDYNTTAARASSTRQEPMSGGKQQEQEQEQEHKELKDEGKDSSGSRGRTRDSDGAGEDDPEHLLMMQASPVCWSLRLSVIVCW